MLEGGGRQRRMSCEAPDGVRCPPGAGQDDLGQGCGALLHREGESRVYARDQDCALVHRQRSAGAGDIAA